MKTGLAWDWKSALPAWESQDQTTMKVRNWRVMDEARWQSEGLDHTSDLNASPPAIFFILSFQQVAFRVS
jgi:hypothetical protein